MARSAGTRPEPRKAAARTITRWPSCALWRIVRADDLHDSRRRHRRSWDHRGLASGSPPFSRWCGADYALLDLAGRTDTSEVEAAFSRTGAPLQVFHSDEPGARAVYGASLLLLRPDLHVFWRGERLPDADRLTTAATGFAKDRFGVPAHSSVEG